MLKILGVAMSRARRVLTLLLLPAVLTGCASAPPAVGSFTQDEPREVVRHTLHERSNLVFLIQRGGVSYRFEHETFSDRDSGSGLASHWFVYRDDKLYTLLPAGDFDGATDAPPCTEEAQQHWLDLVAEAHARDLAKYDFDDPTLRPARDPNRSSTGSQVGAVVLVTGLFAYEPELLGVSAVFTAGVLLPDAFVDVPARFYADDPQFGIGKEQLEAKIGKPWREPRLQDRCEYDFYGGRVFDQYWVQYVYFDGYLYAMQRDGH